jgi:dTDP-4-dehydrorhamnose reductase
MRLVVTGREGQIVRSLMERARGTTIEVVPVARPELDLAAPATVDPALAGLRPDIIVGAAAYTAVDAAESDADAAFAVNGAGAGAVAAAAARLRVPLIHLSTDFVFSGALDRPYVEDDETQPLGVYGASKLAGERAVEAATKDHAILRTAWIYSPFGKNFVRTMLNLARQRPEITVVADQRGTPGNAFDLADGILSVARNMLERASDQSLRGMFHMGAIGETTWDDFARAIFEASRGLNGPSAQVKSITTKDYPTPARRPANSRLDSSKLAGTHGVRLPSWRQSLPGCVERLISAERNV